MTNHSNHAPPSPTIVPSVATGLRRAAQSTPDAIAVADGEGTRSFGDVDAAIADLAARLLAAIGDTPRTWFVPVIVGHDADGVVAIHAALRAGVPFAPIDAALDEAALTSRWERLGRPPVVIGNPDGPAGSLAGLGCAVLWHPDLPELSCEPQSVHPDDPALVIFTSGTSGTPKGVVHNWATLEETLRWIDQPSYSGPAGCRVDSLYPLTLMGGLRRAMALGTGRSVSIIPASRLAADELFSRLDAEGVATLAIIPSHVVALGNVAGGRRLGAVTNVVMGGEQATWDHVATLRNLIATDGVITPAYGMTESPTGVLRMSVGPADPLGTGPLPLGVPVSEDRVRLERLTDDPSGPGELVVCGTLAVGYLDDPRRTASHFGTDPDGTRWWRSGDVVVEGEDGLLRHVARRDDLVKINGRFVDLSIPEGILAHLPGVARAAVVSQPMPHGNPRVVAHVELDADASIAPTDARRALADGIEGDSVAMVLAVHDTLPVTTLGKVDRGALQGLPVHPWSDEATYRPATLVERFVANTVASVLGLASVPPRADVWDLGLDSLGAVEVAARISHEGWGVVLPSDIVDHPTVVDLAAVVSQGFVARPSPLVCLNPEGTRAPLFCFPGAGGTAMGYLALARALGPDQPVNVIEACGMHSPGPIHRTVEREAEAVLPLVLAARPSGTIVLAGHSAGGCVAYEVAHRLTRLGRAAAVVLFDSGIGAERISLATDDNGDRAVDHEPDPVAKVRATSLLTRGLASARFRWRRFYWARFPGPPRSLASRYAGLYGVQTRAARRYVAPPADFPVTLLAVPSSAAPESLLRTVPSANVVAVTGDHTTLLQPPHVTGVADVVQAVLRDVPR